MVSAESNVGSFSVSARVTARDLSREGTWNSDLVVVILLLVIFGYYGVSIHGGDFGFRIRISTSM